MNEIKAGNFTLVLVLLYIDWLDVGLDSIAERVFWRIEFRQ